MTNSGMPGYRDTEAGWIPKDWAQLKLGSIASVRKSKGVAKQGVCCVELEHIQPETGRLLGWDSSGTQASIKTSFRQGDVLFGKLRPYLRKYAVAPFDGICTTEILAIHPNDDLADRTFLFQLMQGDGVFSTVETLSYGTKMPRVSWSDLADIVIGVPSLAEQRRIAAILTAADDKLNIVARQIEATQTLKQGLIQTLFSKGIGNKSADGRWTRHTAFVKVGSAEYPKSWRMGRMGEVAPLVRREVDVEPVENYPELGLRSFGKGTFHKPALTGEQVGSKRLFLIKAGDLLLSNVFAWEGAVAVAGPADDGRYGSHRYITCKVDPHIANVHFVARYLVTPAGLASIGLASPGGAGRNKTLGLAALADIQIPLPPLAEQNAINGVMECVEAKIAALQAKHELYRDLKRGLMQKLLTGEWRVKINAELAA
jgi:type I restriction enzyme S subunit